MNEDLHRAQALILRFRRVLSIAGQLLLVVASNRIAFVLRFDGGLPAWASGAWWQMLPWLVAIRGLTFIPLRLYVGLWRYTSVYDLEVLIGGVTFSSILFYCVAMSPFGPPVYPRSIFIVDALVLTVLLGGIRMARRFYADFSHSTRGKRVLIYGAGDAGERIVRDMKSNARFSYKPVGFVDDDRTKVGRRIHGVPVLGTRHDLRRILERSRPHEVLIATPQADAPAVRSIVRALEPFKVPIKTLPNLREIIDGKVEVAQIRSLAVEDLLTRTPVGLDRQPLRQLIAGRRVLVTGAGGSIGSELCRQIARLNPATLLMFERYENTLHAIRLELEDRKHAVGLFPIVGDVTDAARVNAVLEEHRPEIIFHAAAHKHVPLMEENPCEAVKNNVRGTRVLARAAEIHGVDRFIMISTDKAVNPTSVMGLSKRVAELVVQAQAIGSGTSFSIVRFGNVLGSNGSVVPRFMEQIGRGGPVTVTHPEMRRFFMLIPEAVELVMHAATQAENGATYVLEMGEQVKVLDMARDLIRLSGLVPDADIKVEFIGLRPGEKLYEELVGADEELSPSAVDKILCIRSQRKVTPDLFARVETIEADAFNGRTDAVLGAMRELVGTFGATCAPVTPAEAALQVQPVTAVEPLGQDAQLCPRCSTGRARRSRARSVRERIKRGLTAERLFRCGDCGWRGWLMPIDVGQGMPVDPPSARDMVSLDSAFNWHPPVDRPSFSPRDLQ
jgi:FlaA1/EpsC-like NDP-sugar epimerase